MLTRVRAFLRGHPLLRDAMVWAVPALLFATALRLMFLSYAPYAYWGSDSRSYYNFADTLLRNGHLSLNEKRRYLYPLLMVPVSLFPGPPLKWLAWLQHALGVATLLPLAYISRKTFVHWRLWIVPITILFAGMPVILWYEHELLGETVFFATLLWSFAGWIAWVCEPRIARARQLFWCFFVPLTLFFLTKPSGRFLWPGLCLGLIAVAAWRKLDWRRWAALGVLLLITLTAGSKSQGAWLLYVATFPLTNLQSPRYADYKAEIRPEVEAFRREIDTYYLQDDWAFDFLENPRRHEGHALWKELQNDEKLRTKVYMELALEGIKTRPDLFLYLGLQRLVASANLSEFKEERFRADYFPDRLESSYEEARRKEKAPLRAALGLPRSGPLPSYEAMRGRLSPAPDSWAAAAILSWVRGYAGVADLTRLPEMPEVAQRKITKAEPTALGCWLLAGMLLALLPRYRSSVGVWMVIGLSYVCGVFLVSQTNPRYFAPVWPIVFVIAAVPADALVTALLARWRNRRAL